MRMLWIGVVGLVMMGCADYQEFRACYDRYPSDNIGFAAGAGVVGVMVASAVNPTPSDQAAIDEARLHCMKRVTGEE